jgi:hypothetical protein
MPNLACCPREAWGAGRRCPAALFAEPMIIAYCPFSAQTSPCHDFQTLARRPRRLWLCRPDLPCAGAFRRARARTGGRGQFAAAQGPRGLARRGVVPDVRRWWPGRTSTWSWSRRRMRSTTRSPRRRWRPASTWWSTSLSRSMWRSEGARVIGSRNNRVLAVYQNRRFDADFLTLKDLLASGELGRVGVPGVAFRPLPARGEGALARAGGAGRGPLGGSGRPSGRPGRAVVRPARHAATRHGRLRDGALVEDYFHAVLRYESGTHAPLRVVLHSTTLAAHAAPRYIVHGTRGSYVKHGVDTQEDALRAGHGRRRKVGAPIRWTANSR